MKAKKAYYNVEITRDGIIVLAFPRRKPMTRCRQAPPKIDADGICEQYLDDPEEARKFMDWGKSVRMTAITTHLNVRRLLRDLVESRLVAVEQRVGQLHALLERIEAKLDAVQQSRPR